MNNTNKDKRCINGVSCGVTSCIHHVNGNCCNAEHINVANENAEMKVETFCSTFAPKQGCCN